MHKDYYKRKLLKTLDINGVENIPTTDSNSCSGCELSFEEDELELIAFFLKSISKYSSKYINKYTIVKTDKLHSKTEYPLLFEKAVLLSMCTTCVKESFSRKDLLIIPVNHNGDFKNDYYLLWNLGKDYREKKLNEMYTLALKTLVIDYEPHLITQIDNMLGDGSSGYNELKMHPYLLESTSSELKMHRQIRELTSWSDIQYYGKTEVRKKLKTYSFGLFSVLILIALLNFNW